MSDIGERVALAQVASCTCDTKSPVEKYHDEECRYRLLGDLADEIERLHEANKRLDRCCLEYGKAYARLEDKLQLAEAVIEAARHHAQDQYAAELAEKISTYDKERDDE